MGQSLSPFLLRSRKEAQRDIRSLDEPRGEQFIVPRSEVLAANLLDLPLDAVDVLKIKEVLGKEGGTSCHQQPLAAFEQVRPQEVAALPESTSDRWVGWHEILGDPVRTEKDVQERAGHAQSHHISVTRILQRSFACSDVKIADCD